MGKQFRVKGITACRIVGGKITGHREQFDVLGILQALGLVRLPG